MGCLVSGSVSEYPVNWLALILSIIPIQDDVPPGRIVAIIIPQPTAQADCPPLFGGPLVDAIAKRLDAMQAAWAERETVLSGLIQEIEARQEARDKERFEFLKEWIENLKPGLNGPVDVGPIREFFAEWKLDRENAIKERSEAAAERRSWAEEREQARADRAASASERKTMLERLTESRAALLEVKVALTEARAEVAKAQAEISRARAELAAARAQFVWAFVVLVALLFVIAAVVYAVRTFFSLRAG